MKKYESLFEKDHLEEMANLVCSQTGVDYIIWIMSKTGKEKHKLPRLKIEIEKENRIPVSIEEEPKILIRNLKLSSKDFQKIKRFILLNKELFLEYWKSEGIMDLRTVFKRLKKV